MTRGCVRRCKFCVVHIIEPKYRKYIPFREKLEATRNTYGEQKHLLLLDNNVLASDQYDQITSEIRDAGFHKGATFDKPDYLTINIAQLEQGHTDRGRIIKTTKLLLNYLNKLPESEYKKISKHFIPSKISFLTWPICFLTPIRSFILTTK